jgi:hypothetical protein
MKILNNKYRFRDVFLYWNAHPLHFCISMSSEFELRTSYSLTWNFEVFLSLFRLPGEAQKIDRIMNSFADKFMTDNPNHPHLAEEKGGGQDSCYVS